MYTSDRHQVIYSVQQVRLTAFIRLSLALALAAICFLSLNRPVSGQGRGTAPIADVDKLVASGDPAAPGGLVTYLVWIINNGLTSEPLVNPVIADLLPASLEFVSWTPTLCNTDAYTLERIDNFNMTGRTLLRITFNGSVPTNNTCGGEVQVRVRAGTPPGTVQNSLHLIGYTNPVIITDRCKAWAADIYDLDNDGDTSELLCSDVASITVMPTPPPLPAAIGDRVWFDTNRDGIQDAGETGVPGVTVTLRSPAGAVLSTTMTCATGFYHFTGLTPGDYFICFVPPAGYSVSPQNQGADDALDSDPSLATFCTVTTTLSPGEDDLTWDMGLYIPPPPPRRHRRPGMVRHQPRRHPGRGRDRRLPGVTSRFARPPAPSSAPP